MGFGVTSSAPCLAAVFGVCSFLFVTIGVAPEKRARELRTRGSTVLTQDSQESQMGRMLTPSTEDQISCISRLSLRSLSLLLDFNPTSTHWQPDYGSDTVNELLPIKHGLIKILTYSALSKQSTYVLSRNVDT